jgi:cobalt-zinc-cadmium efflux system membrane fusion protein
MTTIQRTLALAVLLAAACTKPHAPAEEPVNEDRPTNAWLADGGIRMDERSRPYVTVKTVGEDSSSAVTLRAPARVAFRDNAVSRVGAPIAARVMELSVRVGDYVKIGDSLATLASPDASSFHGELARSQVELSAARKSLERQTEMVNKGVGREYDRVSAEMEVRDVSERVRAAKRNVGLLGKSSGGTVIVTAQIEGTVLRRNATVGAQVDPNGEPLFEIGNPNDLRVVADVFQDDLSLVRDGAKVVVELASRSEPVHGTVSSVGVLLDTAVRRAPVYIDLGEEHRAGLKPGMFARANISASDVEGITIPVSAVLIKDGDRSIVYLERKDGAFERREVVVGHNFEDTVEIVSGLQLGDRVAVKGALLIDGAANQLL